MATQGDTQRKRRHRELVELLQELRVAIIGVQVLFAFLLTVPFSERYTTLDGGQRRIYVLAVVATAVSSLLLIAPAANHLRRTGNPLAVSGLVLLAVGMGLALYLVTALVYDDRWAAVVSGAVGAMTVLTWFVFPAPFHTDDDDH